MITILRYPHRARIEIVNNGLLVVCVAMAMTLMFMQPARADLPPRLQVEGVLHPINQQGVADKTTAEVIIPSDPRAVMVRPPARLIQVKPTPRLQPRPTIVRPRPQVLRVQPAPRPIVSNTPLKVTPAVTPVARPNVKKVAAAGDRISRSVEEALETRGSVTFRKTPLTEVVFMLSELWGINIVAGENVNGEVSGSFRDAPLREVLSAALTATGYGYRQTGNSLIVLPVDKVGTEDPDFVTRTIQLPPALRKDDSLLKAAELLLGERGQIRKIGDNTVLIVDTNERVARINALFQELAPPTATPTGVPTPVEIAADPVTQSGIAYFTPQFTEAEEMAGPLQTALGENVTVAVYAEENRIMVKGNPDELRLAGEAIEQLDKPRAQVRITAMIYDVGLSELEQLGLNYSRDLRAIANSRDEVLENVSTSIDEIFRFTSDLTTSGLTSTGIRTITDTFEASVFLEALDTVTEAKLLADPSITVGDRRQASIRIVRRIPIVGSNPVENSNAVFTQTEFEEAGVILNVLPRISRDGTIELKVQPEYSVVAELLPTGPVIDSRQADTTVRVGNGHMFVLGGLRQKTVVESQRGIPYLKDIKHVGKFFRSHNTEVRESELIVFLKPEVITPYSPGNVRGQAAGASAGEQLDAIPYAESVPSSPYCQDHHCPNHHPRPRINGGAPSDEIDHTVPHVHPVEISDAPQDNDRAAIDTSTVVPVATETIQDEIRVVSDEVAHDHESEEETDHTIVIDGGYYPPVYVDTRAIDLGTKKDQ